MTPEEAKALGWCTKPGCECDAAVHFPPQGTPKPTAEEVAALELRPHVQRPHCACRAFKLRGEAGFAAIGPAPKRTLFDDLVETARHFEAYLLGDGCAETHDLVVAVRAVIKRAEDA